MTTDQFVKDFSSVTKAMAEQSQRVDKSWWGISRSVDHIGETFEKSWGAAISRQFGKQGTIMTGLDQLSKFIRDPKAFEGATTALSAEKNALRERARLLYVHKKAGVASQEEIAELGRAKEKFGVINSTLPLMKQINKLKLEGATYAPALLVSLKDTVKFSDQMQASLMQANSALGERYRLMKDIAAVQRSTGASAETLAEATAAATKYGLEMQPTFREDLDIITKMKEGMGVSASESASLVASMRLMGQSSKGVADAIARIKTDTGLAADEATRLAKQITMAMAVMAPGGNVAKVVETIGRLEGAAVQLGFSSGKITDMMTNWTKQSGLMSVGMLGLDPGFMKDNTTAMMGFQKMVEFTEQQLKGTEGNAYARQAVLEQFAEIFGTTTDVIANGRNILSEYNKQASTATTLQQEWQKQTSSFAKSWDKLKNQLAGLIHGVLLPLVGVLQKVVDLTTKVVTGLAESKYTLYAFALALSYTFGHTLIKLIPLVKGVGSALGSISGLGPLLGRIGPLVPTFTKFFGGLSLSGPGLLAAAKFLGPVALAGSAGWAIGQLIYSNNSVAKSMQKLFAPITSKLYGTDHAAPDAMRAGTMSQQAWSRTVANMRSANVDERTVSDWATENTKLIDVVQRMPQNMREDYARILQNQFTKDGLLRQRMREVQGMSTDTSGEVSKETKRQTDILLEQRDLALIQKAVMAEDKTLAQNERMRLAKAAEDAVTAAAFRRAIERDRQPKRFF